MLEDIPSTLEAIGSMIAQPIDTVKYIGNVVIESFNRDVINGDAESRAHWFTYAAGSIFGFKGLGNAGKAGAQAAKQGVQKAGQKLDELLPYHPKHQLAVDGPVPYNVYDGNFFKDQLMVKINSYSNNKKGLPSNNTNKLLNKELLDEISKSGVKCNLKQIVMIGRDTNGNLLWLEKGNTKAGLKHIVNGHVKDFDAKGIQNIPVFLHETLKLTPVKQGVGPKGPYSIYSIEGHRYTLAYGSNGFIVSFYPSK